MSVGVVASHPEHRRLYEATGIPTSDSRVFDVNLILSDTILPVGHDVGLKHASFVRLDVPGQAVRTLHQWGSHFIDLRLISFDRNKTLPRPIYGPGTSHPILPTAPFHGIGLHIHRDDPQVVSALAASARSSAPMGWIRPGFPTVLTMKTWFIDGRSVVGSLCASVDRPGGFVVLESTDIVRLMGYRSISFLPSDLIDLVPFRVLEVLLEWASVPAPVRTPRGSSPISRSAP